MNIAIGTVVSLRHIIKTSNGEIIDDISQQTPIKIIYGVNTLLPEIESQIYGMHCKLSKSFLLKDPSNGLIYNIEVFIDDVRSATEEELSTGMVDPLCGPGCVC